MVWSCPQDVDDADDDDASVASRNTNEGYGFHRSPYVGVGGVGIRGGEGGGGGSGYYDENSMDHQRLVLICICVM